MNWDNHKDVMSAIHESSENLRFASDRIKDDKYFLLHILMSDWHRVYHDEGKFAGKYYPRDYRHSIWDAILQGGINNQVQHPTGKVPRWASTTNN